MYWTRQVLLRRFGVASFASAALIAVFRNGGGNIKLASTDQQVVIPRRITRSRDPTDQLPV